jgi:hypothetical protein
MFTFTHPLAPTVTYGGDLKKAIASYASDHLHEFDVFLVEVESSNHGIGIEVVEKATENCLGLVSIH